MFPRCFRYVAFLITTVAFASDEALPYTSWSGSNASRVLRMLLDEKNYDKRLRPNYEGKPLAILVTVFITSLGGLDEREMQFESTFFMREAWTDPRLAFGKYYSRRNLTLNGEIIDQIWIPDTYINNEKSITASKNEFLLTMFPDGKVMYSQRVTVTAACKMDLRNFPMDYQNCSLLFESYSMTTKDLYFSWDDGGTGDLKNAVTVGKELIMSQFALDDYAVDEITANYVTGSFALLKLTFHLRRKKFYYVVSIYIPTILITILSWVSFWIPRNSPPARVALGITTVLALTTLIFGIQSSMPKVSYVKAIDWFMCVSFLYVFAALVEYPSSTFVKSQAQKLTRKGTDILRKVKGIKNDPEDFPLSSGAKYGSTDKPRDDQFDLRKLPRHRNGENNAKRDQNALENNMEGFKDQNDHWGKRQYPDEDEGDFIDNFRDNKMLNVVDKYARIGFPLSYFLFNVCYWIIFLTSK